MLGAAWSGKDILFGTLALIVLSVVVRALVRNRKIFVTVYEWEHALLYVNGRFSRLLSPGRHLNLGLSARLDIYTLRRHDQLLATSSLDVTSLDRLAFRVSAVVVYEVTDPQQAFVVEDRDAHLGLAITTALTALAAEHTVEAFLSERTSLDEKLLARLPSSLVGCTIKAATLTAVILPPELRRTFTEVERAKLEGLAALERARGEHAALRSLSNAARMLKGNPELMNLRMLQALSASSGKRPPTLVLAQNALLAVDSNAPSDET